MTRAQNWRHRWQVVHLFHNGPLIFRCSHRWQATAGWCARVRDVALAVRDRADVSHHDVRRTPERSR